MYKKTYLTSRHHMMPSEWNEFILNEFVWAGLIGIFLLIYLAYTIVHPEKF